MSTIVSQSNDSPFVGNISQITEYNSPSLFSPPPLPITITRNSDGTYTINFPSTGWNFVVRNRPTLEVISQNLSGANVTIPTDFNVIIDFRNTFTASFQDTYSIFIGLNSTSATVTRNTKIQINSGPLSPSSISVTKKNNGFPINVPNIITFDDPQFSPPPLPVVITTVQGGPTRVAGTLLTVFPLESTFTIGSASIKKAFFPNGSFRTLSITMNDVNIIDGDPVIFQFPSNNGILGDRYELVFVIRNSRDVVDVTVRRAKGVTFSG